MSPMTRMGALCALTTLAGLVAAAPPTRAETIVDHAVVFHQVSLSEGPVLQSDEREVVGDFLAETFATLGGRGSRATEAQARSFAGLLRARTYSLSERLAEDGFQNSNTAALARAGWRDTLRLVPPIIGGGTPGPVVRLRFLVDGTMDASPAGGSQAGEGGATFVGFRAQVERAGGVRNAAGTGYFFDEEDNPTVEQIVEEGEGWARVSFGFTNFAAELHLDIPFDEVLASAGAPLFYELSASTATASAGGASSDYFGTARLGSITLVTAGGEVTPESLGYAVVFGSGLPSPNLAVVPEPASLALAVPALLAGMIGWRWRRCRAA